MSSEPCNQRRTTTAKTRYAAGAPLPDTEHLPCPHCDSTNSASTTTITSQPRHFYKACRRYMTHGGKLHDIPIVGGSQKNAKRLRLTTTHNIPPPFNPTTWLTLSPSNLNPLHKRTRRRVAFSCRQEIGAFKDGISKFRRPIKQEKKEWLTHAYRMKVKRAINWLYKIALTTVKPVCLQAKLDDIAWLWHARLGHVNFHTLEEMGRKETAYGLPKIVHTDQVCEGCIIGKLPRRPFPQEAQWQAT
ncbi:hypothetical protein E3N88_09754 [Mikania micrantha]|uniref:GAG-pre-integrase domain-containing protein n=1 Tax=Mikania micrantha TaxID=192012 RepID=A0A5N6PKT6_9ASTR|nr:hypothetical protein E3N88_09754 [Mikania micrantha]